MVEWSSESSVNREDVLINDPDPGLGDDDSKSHSKEKTSGKHLFR